MPADIDPPVRSSVLIASLKRAEADNANLRQQLAEARAKALEEAARVAERDVDWTRFLRRSKTDWKTGDEENVFAPPREPDDTMPTDANVFAYKIGIGAGSVIATAIRALSAGKEG